MAIFQATSGVSDRTGGRKSARRLLAAVAVALCPVSAAQPSATATPEPTELTVREANGVYAVTARFHVSQPVSTALAVLTDYEQIPRFMPGVTTSIVRERTGGRLIVEQEAVSRMMMFTKRVFLLLEVHAEGNTIRFRDAGGRSFSCYEGQWRVSDDGGQTLVSYELNAKPSFDVPQFLLTRLLKRDSKAMIERLRAEIASRPS